VYYNEWLRDRRARRKQGAELIARVRVLLGDADPASFSLGTMRERNQRHGQELWRRWYELRESFLKFGLLGSADERELSKRAATDVALTIQALRNSVDDDVDDADRAKMRQTAKQRREQASSIGSRALCDVGQAARRRESGSIAATNSNPKAR
jgi:hypothetical protein